MIMWKLAFDNLRFDIKRTVMLILILTVSIVALLATKGYVNYSAEGMKEGYVSQTGALQIAHRSFWATESEEKLLLTSKDEKILTNILDNT